ncbi:MAG: hypothetical protein CMJ19_09770 [Phycisphaeraceae bacterium]|nr:hypothetical protein [Phycisphaeraceae bacterium]
MSILILTATLQAQTAGEWKLKPIVGDNTKQWAEGSWTWSMGNPMDDNGATWKVAYQDQTNPPANAPFTAMSQGTYVGFVRIWQGGEEQTRDPQIQYKADCLSVRPSSNKAQKSPSAAVIFKPTADGQYTVDLKTKLTAVQSPSAGYANVELYILSADGRIADMQQQERMNVKKSNAYGKKQYPERFDFSKTIKLQADQELILRLQAINPGNASVGNCRLQIEDFSVKQSK